jgi:hypothetical protein
MTPPSHLVAYIAEQRKQAVADSTIRSDLLDQGYPALLIDTLLEGGEPEHRKADFIHRPAVFVHPEEDSGPFATQQTEVAAQAPKTSVPESAVSVVTSLASMPKAAAKIAASVKAPAKLVRKDPHLKTILTGAIAILTVVAVGCWALVSRPDHEAAAIPVSQTIAIKDQNYTINLPKDWLPNSDYSNGAGVNVFYQPGGMTVRKSRLTIFVTPKVDGSADYVNTQLAGLRQNGGTATVIDSQSVSFGQAGGTITQLRSTAPSNPSDLTYHIYMTTVYGSTEYDIDAMVPDTQWDTNKQAILTSMKSFRPTNPAVTHRQPATEPK